MQGANEGANTKSWRWIVAAAAALAVLTAGVWLVVRRVGEVAETLGIEPAALRCRPTPDFSASFKLVVSTELKLNASALIGDPRIKGRMLSSQAGFQSRLRVRAMEQRKHATVLALQLDQIAPTSANVEVSRELSAELSRPFFAVLNEECRIAETGFAPDLSAEAINRLQALTNSMSMMLDGKPGQTTWTTKEHDSVGQYSARYEQGAAADELTKQRIAYLQVHAQPGMHLKGPLLVRILSSKTSVTMDDAHAWLASVNADDHHQITRSDASLVADLKTTLSLERSEDNEPLAATLLSDMRWRSDEDVPLEAVARRPDPPDYMKQMTLEEALGQYAQLFRTGGGAQAAEFLSQVLRSQPEFAFELMALLKSNQIPAALESTIFLALEMSGTTQAHEALIQGLSNEHAPRNRARAAAALPDIPNPSTKTVAALSSTAREALAESKDETQLVRNSASYALGALEQRTRTKDPLLAKQALKELRGQLGRVNSPNELAAALDAIGNSGNPALITDLKPHLAAKDTLVRTHAIEAMGHMDPETNKGVFRQLIEGEQDARVRSAIAKTYADQARRAEGVAPSEVVKGALDVLVREPDPQVRALLIDLVGPAAAKDPRAMQALAEQFRRESDPILLRQIGRYVPADKLGS